MGEETANCPACDKPRIDGTTECPHCGVIFARYRKRVPPSNIEVVTLAPAQAELTGPTGLGQSPAPRVLLARLPLRQLETFLLAAGESLSAGISLPVFARGAGGAMLPPALGARFAELMDQGVGLVAFLEELGLPGSADAAILQAADKRGELPAALAALAGVVESRRKARTRLMGQLLYPALLLAAWVAIEPLALLVLKGPVAYFSQVLPRILPLLLALSLGPYLAHRMSAGSPLFQWLVVPMSIVPPFAQIARHRAKAAFAEVLGSGLRAGLPLYESIALAGGAAHHRAFGAPLAAAAEAIHTGARLYVALERLPFSREERAWIQHGEETGHLDAALSRVAERNREQAKLRTRVLFMTVALLFAVFVLARLLLGTIAAYKGYFELLDGILEPVLGGGLPK